MLFFSELIGKNVYSEDQRELGILSDFIFLNAETPKVTKIVTTNKLTRREIPIESLKKVNSHIVIKRTLKRVIIRENELSARKTLLDKQIIDLVGNKVVRANDIVFQDSPILSISGIDIGVLGLLRRLGLERPISYITHLLHVDVPMTLLSWSDILTLELKDGQIKLKQHEERLSKIHEEDLADYLEMTNIQNIHSFLKTLDSHKAADVIENLTINYQVDLFQRFEPQQAADVIVKIDPDEAVDILLAIDRTKRDKIMKILPKDKQQELHQLMTFSRTPVGKLMTSEFFAVESHMTAADILKSIKTNTADFSWLQAIYVLNRDDQLVGVFNTHELLMQAPDMPAYKFMIPEPIVVLLTTPIEVVIYKLFKYKIAALPVINREKRILGIITVDDVADIILKKIQ